MQKLSQKLLNKLSKLIKIEYSIYNKPKYFKYKKMTTSSSTLWMGDIDNWMEEQHIVSVFNNLSKPPT
jgi:hypothetical protein